MPSFGLVSPILTGSGLSIGFIIFALLEYSPGIYGKKNSTIYLALTVGFPLLLILLYDFLVIVLAVKYRTQVQYTAQIEL